MHDRIIILAMIGVLTGCGVETVGTAAVVAAGKEQEIRQGQQLKEDIQKKLDAAAQLEQQRLKEAAGQ